jgi:hypothetical protein
MSTGFITRHKSVGSYPELKIRSKIICRIIISRRFSADPKYFSILHLIEAASEKLGASLVARASRRAASTFVSTSSQTKAAEPPAHA